MDGFGRWTKLFSSKWTEVDEIFVRTVHLMDGFGRWTVIIVLKVDERTDGRSVSWMDSDGGPSLSHFKWTAGRMDGPLI